MGKGRGVLYLYTPWSEGDVGDGCIDGEQNVISKTRRALQAKETSASASLAEAYQACPGGHKIPKHSLEGKLSTEAPARSWRTGCGSGLRNATLGC